MLQNNFKTYPKNAHPRHENIDGFKVSVDKKIAKKNANFVSVQPLTASGEICSQRKNTSKEDTPFFIAQACTNSECNALVTKLNEFMNTPPPSPRPTPPGGARIHNRTGTRPVATYGSSCRVPAGSRHQKDEGTAAVLANSRYHKHQSNRRYLSHGRGCSNSRRCRQHPRNRNKCYH